MKFNDNRSFKVLVVPDFIINPSQYRNIPDTRETMKQIESLGYGIIKMPPAKIRKKSAIPWIESVVDQIEEYNKRGFSIKVLYASFMNEGGVWLSDLRKMLEERGIEFKDFVSFTKEDLENNRIAQKV